MVKVGTNVRKWFRLLRLNFFFSPHVVYFMEKNCHRAIGVKDAGIGFWLEKQNSWPLHNRETRVWFPVRTATRSTNLWGFRTQQIPTICVFVRALVESRSFNTTVSIPTFYKKDLEMLWAHSVLHSNSDKKYWVYNSDAGKCSMSLVLHHPTHRLTYIWVVSFWLLPHPPICLVNNKPPNSNCIYHSLLKLNSL